MSKTLEQELLEFLNAVSNAKEIVDSLPDIEDLSLNVAKSLLKKRNSLPGKKFKSIKEFKKAAGFNQTQLDRILDAVKSLLGWLPNSRPVFMLPVRIETRFISDSLWVRIYPDQVFVDAHEPRLTRKEHEAGIRYFDAINTVPDGTDPEQHKHDAWRRLAQLFGPERAAWIARTISEKTVQLQEEPQRLFITPKLMALPYCFVVYAYRRDNTVVRITGKPIPRDLKLFGDSSDTLGVSLWVTDHSRAQDVGMAIRVPLSKNDRKDGFSRIIVVGVAGDGAANGRPLLEKLIEAHHYSTGLGFLKYNTPTNNTQTTKSGHSESQEDREASYDIEVTGVPNWDDPRANGMRLSHALGLDSNSNVFRHVALSGYTSDSYAQEMQTALWPATGDFFLRYLLAGIVSDDGLAKLAQHFTRFVRAAGPLSAIRVGSLPYGILPVTSVRPRSDDHPASWTPSKLDNNNDATWSAFDAKLHYILIRLHKQWMDLAKNPDRVPRITPDGDPDKELLEILAMEPMSSDYWLRPVVDEGLTSWLLLAMRDQVFGPGTPFEESRTHKNPLSWAKEWVGAWDEFIDGNAETWSKLTGVSADELSKTPLFRLISWRSGRNLELEITRHESIEGRESPDTYLDKLSKGTDYADSQTLLRDLLQRSIRLAEKSPINKLEVLSAIVSLSGLGILEFFNSVKTPEEIVQHIVDDPDWKRRPPRAYGIRLSLAKKILGFKESLDGKRFTSIEQLESIPGIGEDTMHDIMYSFRDHPSKLDLDMLFRHTLDLCSHRLDAWITSLATKRLEAMRAKVPGGIYLGAYGYVEDLKPESYDRVSAGYLLAPSMGQATAAAVLHNAFLTHDYGTDEKGNPRPNPFRISLTSGPVRRALDILEGIRQGQPLGALLGYRFEKRLIERGLAQYIDEFRAAFPLVANKEQEQSEGESVEALSARNVVDGLAVARWWDDRSRKDITPPDRSALEKLLSLLKPEKDEKDLSGDSLFLRQEVRILQGSLDAVSDLLLYEGVYHAARGNYERSGAALDALSGNALPPDIESVATPVAGKSLGHRMCLLFPDADGDPKGPRASAEPRIAAWYADLIGDLEKIWFSFQSNSMTKTCSLAELNKYEECTISPVDLLYMSALLPNNLDAHDISSGFPYTGQTEIEQRIAYWVRREFELGPDQRVEISFSRPDGFTYGLGEALELGSQVLNTLGSGKPLRPDSLYLPGDFTSASFAAADFIELTGRLDDAKEHVDSIMSILGKSIGDGSDGMATRAEVIDSLFRAGRYGVSGAIPPSPDEPVEALDARRRNVLAELKRRLDEFQGLLAKIEDVGPQQKIDLLAAAMKALFGKGFHVLPTFSPPVYTSSGERQEHKDLWEVLGQEGPLCPKGESRVRLWLQQAAVAHPSLLELEDCLIVTELWREPTGNPAGPAFALHVAQLPVSSDAKWLALDDDERGEQINADIASGRGALSIVAAVAGTGSPADKTEAMAGLLMDQWDELIPDNKVTAGVSFHYDGPSSQAPQCLLLAVPGQRADLMDHWHVDELADIVEDTMDLARIRAVDPDAMAEGKGNASEPKGLGLILPALLFPVDPSNPGWERETSGAVTKWMRKST